MYSRSTNRCQVIYSSQARIKNFTNHRLEICQLITEQGISDDGIGVQIAAPPIDGKANDELLDFMSEVTN